MTTPSDSAVTLALDVLAIQREIMAEFRRSGAKSPDLERALGAAVREVDDPDVVMEALLRLGAGAAWLIMEAAEAVGSPDSDVLGALSGIMRVS